MRIMNRVARRAATALVTGGLAGLLAGLVLLALAPATAQAQRAELEKVIRRRVLPNGLEVIAVENHGVPLATVEVVVRNGAFVQTPAYAGLAHLYEHMFFKANAAHPEPDETIQALSELGAVFNASTREELVNYYLTLPSDSLQAGLRVLAAALTSPLFLSDELERERQVVLAEYDRNQASPFFRFEQETGKKLWGSAFSRKNPIGERAVLAGATPDQMRALQKLYYVPNNSVLIVSGDIVPDSVFALAQRHLGSWARGADPFAAAPIPPVPPVTRDAGLILEDETNAVTVQLQWHGPSVRQQEAATFWADVYSDILNAPQSRFQRKLVDSGLFQGVIVNYYTLNQVGPITVSGQTTPEKLRQAIPALVAALKETITPGYFTAEELEAAKASRAVTSAFGRERSSEFSHTIGFWWSVSGLDYYLKYVDEMARTTPAQLRQYATTYILGKPHVTSVLLPPGTARRLGLTEAELVRLGAF